LYEVEKELTKRQYDNDYTCRCTREICGVLILQILG